MAPVDVLVASGVPPAAAADLVHVCPTLLQMMNDLADSIYVGGWEDFKNLAAEALNSIISPQDITIYPSVPDIAQQYRAKLQNHELAINALIDVQGSVVRLTLAGTALVKSSKFRPVWRVQEGYAKIYDADVLRVSS